jgi:DNA-binding transcriptional ArsR family regulator
LPEKRRERTRPKVLLFLAKNGEGSKWEISRGLKKAYSNVHSTIKELLDLGLIEVKRKRKSAKNPKMEVEYYRLTFSGLFAALLQPKITWEDICEIAERQAKMLPLIFGKWSHFRASGVPDEYLLRALKWVCSLASSQEPSVDSAMWGFSLYIFQMAPPTEKVAWLKAVRSDQELREWALQEEKAFHAFAKIVNTTFNLLQEPDPDWEKAVEKLRSLQWTSYKASFKETEE